MTQTTQNMTANQNDRYIYNIAQAMQIAWKVDDT